MTILEIWGNLGYNNHMNRKEKVFAIWGMSGGFYDAIMQSCPAWVWTDQEFDDWLFSQIGL